MNAQTPAPLAGLVPNLMVKDVQASANFYQTHLGFTLTDKVVVGDHWVWCMLVSGGARLMLQDIPSSNAQDGFTQLQEPIMSGALFITVTDVHTVHAALHQALPGAVRPLHQQNYGLEFNLKDPNGYPLIICQLKGN